MIVVSLFLFSSSLCFGFVAIVTLDDDSVWNALKLAANKRCAGVATFELLTPKRL